MATNTAGSPDAPNRSRPWPPRPRPWLTRLIGVALIVATLPGLEMGREEIDYRLLGRESAVRAKVNRVKADSRVMERLAGDAAHTLPQRYGQLPVTMAQLRQVREGKAGAQKLIPPVTESTPNVKAANFSSTLGRAAVVEAVTQTALDTARHSLRGSALQADYRRHLSVNVSRAAAEEEATIKVDLAAMNDAMAHRGDGLPLMRKLSEFDAEGPELGVIYDTGTGSYIPADWSNPEGVLEVTKVYPLTFDAAIQEQRVPGLSPIE